MVIQFEGKDPDVLFALQVLLLEVVWILLIDEDDVEKPSLITFPRIAVSYHLGNFDNFLPSIASLLLQFSNSIFFIIAVFNETSWELQAKLADGRAKIGNHDYLQGLIFLLNYWQYFNPIQIEVTLSIWSVGGLIVLDSLVSYCKVNAFDSKPFLLERDLFFEYFTLLKVGGMHTILNNNKLDAV